VGVAESQRAWADQLSVGLQRLVLAVNRLEDLAVRLEVLEARLVVRLAAQEGERAATAQALQEALESGSSGPDTPG